jgi:hypothetical protein
LDQQDMLTVYTVNIVGYGHVITRRQRSVGTGQPVKPDVEQ